MIATQKTEEHFKVLVYVLLQRFNLELNLQGHQMKSELHVRKRTWSLCLQTLPHNPVTRLGREVYLHQRKKSLESQLVDYTNLDHF